MILQYNTKNIIIIGDVHGEFKTLNWEIHSRRKIEDTLLIQIGDFGAGFYKKEYYVNEFYNLNKSLKNANNHLIVLRGNHDNPSYFNGSWSYSNMQLIPDYTLIKTLFGNIICIGGAASIDKDLRSAKTWWKEELPEYNLGKLKKLENENISYVLAHDNPNFCHPVRKSPSMNEEITAYAQLSRKTMGNIYDYLSNFHNILRWINGHYHWSYEEINKTTFITLNIMEFKNLIDTDYENL